VVSGERTGTSRSTSTSPCGEPGEEADPERSVLEYPALRLDAGGTFEMTVNSNYSLPNEGKVALIDVFAYVTDDAGFNGQVGGRLVVQ
jgi:hypothetical protein